MTPRVEDVPEIDTLIRRVHACSDVTCACDAFLVGEARHGLVRVEVAAGWDPRAPWIAAEVHVHLAGPRLEPNEADQVAAVAVDAVDVRVRTADARVERVGHPARAIDGRVDPVRKLLPTGTPGVRARRFHGFGGRLLARWAGAARRERE